MMLMVALGEMTAILLTSCCLSSRFSILTMSFSPFFPLAFIVTVMASDFFGSGRLSTLRTLSELPELMWSMTVPFLIGVTLSCFIVCLLGPCLEAPFVRALH